MRIKRYEALSMKEAIDWVREDLGPDAVIHILGFNQRENKIHDYLNLPRNKH